MSETLLAGSEVSVKEIGEPPEQLAPTSAKVLYGKLIPAMQQICLFSHDDWEEFIHEWVHYQKEKYKKVVRVSGANDLGIDVAAFFDDAGFTGIWDNYQCKHYGAPITPQVAIPEIGKMLRHSYSGHFAPPHRYYFMAPRDCGISLTKLLGNPSDLKAKVFEKWDDWCAKAITSKETINLDGDFLSYAESFDYSIFTTKTALEAIDEHRDTPYHAARFGGGLPDRPPSDTPPATPVASESRYLQQLFEAYGDNKNDNVKDGEDLVKWPDLEEHYHRQRQYFYHAESLRNFSRDTVPSGTFLDLQNEVYDGVIEVEAAQHSDALVRVNAVTQAAAELPLAANGLISVTKIPDKRGICHQLANNDRLKWKK